MIQKLKKFNVPLPHLIAFLIFVILGIFLTKYLHYIWNKDEINYISIAEKYARGEFSVAPNALWAPLLSWLLAVLICLGLPSLAAAKMLSLMIGGLTFFGVRSLSYAFEVRNEIRTLMLYLLIPVLLYCSLMEFTPDLLLTGLLAFYLSLTFNRQYAERPWFGLLSGLLGALSYFAKGYAFYFFIFHFLLVNFLHYLTNAESAKRKIVLRNLATGFIAFFVLTAGWVYLLDRKYHEVTIGVNGKYNYRKAGPEYQGNPNGMIGFAAPPDATAVSHWEDPYYYFSRADLLSCCLKPWSPLDSRSSFFHQVKLTSKTAPMVFSMYQSFTVFFSLIIVAALLLCLVSWRQLISSRRELLFGLTTFFLYSAGYCIFYVEERYLWAMWTLVLLMGGYALNLLLKTEFFADSRVRRALAVLVFSLSFVLPPIDKLRDSNYKTKRIGGNISAFSSALENDNLKNAKIASNTDYGTSVGIAYRMGAKYYGVSDFYHSKDEIVEQLKKNKIDYYFVLYPQTVENPSMLKGNVESPSLIKVKEIRGIDQNLWVYSVVY